MRFSLSSALALFGVALAVFPASLNAEEIDDGVFKWLYADEIKREYMDAVSLAVVKKSPASFINVYVKLRVRFNRIEEGLFVPEYTSFSDTSYLNFSVWDSTATLWQETEMKDDFPYMFVDKNSHAAQQIIRLRRFDIVEVYGRVVSLFEGKPWFEVEKIWLKKESELSNTLFAHIRLAEDMFEKGVYDLVVGEIDRILGYDLSDELAGQLLKRKGLCLLIQKKYTEAEVSYNRASALRPRDAEVFKGWGESLMRDGRYSLALWSLSKSLVFQAKQAEVYAMMGYCRAKMADEKIADLTPQKAEGAGDIDYTRRRDKQVRIEYNPGRAAEQAHLTDLLTRKDFEEIVKLFELALLDCRKALFITPVYPEASEWMDGIQKRFDEFKKLGEAPAPKAAGEKAPPPPPGGSSSKGPPPPPK